MQCVGHWREYAVRGGTGGYMQCVVALEGICSVWWHRREYAVRGGTGGNMQCLVAPEGICSAWWH